MKLLTKLSVYGSNLFKNKCTSRLLKFDKMAKVIQCADLNAANRAAEMLAHGHIIAVPTDTIYGLACSANCPEAIKKLYNIKGRDSEKPVAICVTDITDVRKWGEASHLDDKLFESMLPGPITIVLRKSKHLDNPYLNPSTTKIGIRIPNHAFMNKVTKLFNLPIALTSANFSNEPSTLCVREFEELYGALGAVFDGGILSQGLEQNRTGSTVIDLSDIGYYKIIRKGISYEEIITNLEKHGLRCII